jgi:hypothetical protein
MNICVTQLKNWKVYALAAALWYFGKDKVMNILLPYIDNMQYRLIAATLCAVAMSCVLITLSEKLMAENFETIYQRDMKMVAPFCEDACKKISNLDERGGCENECNVSNSQY